MEASEQFKRITTIAHSKISVSEDSPIYPFFAQRREVCKKLLLSQEGTYRDVLLTNLSYVEGNIKGYLYL